MKTLKTLFILLFISAAAGSQTLIPSGSIWKYLANGSNQGNAWSAPNFYDAVWNSGAAKLGYGDPVVTTVPYGSSINKYITTYFRKTFLVSNPSTVTS